LYLSIKDVIMLFVGIDIAKLTFDVAVLIDGQYHNRQFTRAC